MKDLKIRASAMANITALDRKTTITERQKKTLEDLKMKIQLTEYQAKERDRLQKKLDAPPSLSEGGKTYVKDIFITCYLRPVTCNLVPVTCNLVPV